MWAKNGKNQNKKMIINYENYTHEQRVSLDIYEMTSRYEKENSKEKN